jgi:hypothetical protein
MGIIDRVDVTVYQDEIGFSRRRLSGEGRDGGK